jgi:hypothetical protein
MIEGGASTAAATDEVSQFFDQTDFRNRIRQLIKMDETTKQPYCILCNQVSIL